MSKLSVAVSAFLLLSAGTLASSLPLRAQSGPDLAAMLGQAQRFTVKVRGTVQWPFAGEQVGTGLGTGFIIDRAKGWILTNAHVAKRSQSIVEIALGDAEGEWLAAERVYVDNHLDVAVLKVDPAKLPADATTAKLGCTQTVAQGATVVAYGHPISLNFTATRGIVSSIRILGAHEYVQMDANINPGNSGGPLLGVDPAEVVGINTANIPGAPGLGLALSIKPICAIVDLLGKDLDPSLPSLPVYWLKQGRIETLTVAVPFPQSGDNLLGGDVVQGIAGGPKLATLPDLYTALRGRRDSVSLTVQRDGRLVDVSVPLIPAWPPLQRQGLIFAGLLIGERINADKAATVLPPLRIEFIKPGEAAARAGLQMGDSLEMVGTRRFTTVGELHDWLKTRPVAEKVPLLVRRGSGADPRVVAEFHRFELAPLDLRLITSGK